MKEPYHNSTAQVRDMEHDSDSPETRKVSMYGYDYDNTTKRRVAVDSSGRLSFSQLVPEKYDEIALTYVASGDGAGEIETVVYKLASATVATLTLGYDASDRLNSVAKT